MTLEKITYLLKHPNLIEISDVSNLQSVVSKYPYFQAARAIQLKALKKSGSFLYNQKLKETAAYTNDREILFRFISSKSFSATPQSTAKEITIAEVEEVTSPTIAEADFTITQTEANQISDKELFQQPAAVINPTTQATEEKISTINPNAPLEFSPDETHSFSEWLKLTTAQPIVRKVEKPKKQKLIESPLIDKFLKTNPKIKPVKKSAPTINLASQNNTQSNDLMTETLAKVYIAQKNYKKAIQAYKILSLKNPEKSGLFADQIRAIKKLRDNN